MDPKLWDMVKVRRVRYHPFRSRAKQRLFVWVLAWIALFVSILEILSLGALTSDGRVALLFSDWLESGE